MKEKVKYLIVWFCLCVSFITNGQESNINLVNSLNDSSYYLGSSSPKQAINVARKSLNLAKKIGYLKGEIMAYCRIGNAQVKMDELDYALSSYKLAEKQFRNSKEDPILLSKILNYQAAVYRRQGKMDLALNSYSSSYSIAERGSDLNLMASSIMNMSIIYKEQGDYKEAMVLLHDGLKFLPKDDKNEFGTFYNGMGNIYEDQERFDEAIKMYKKAESCFEVTGNLYSRLMVTVNLGNCFWDLNQLDSARFYYNSALSPAIDKSFKEIESIIYQNIGGMFAEKKDLDSASVYYRKSFEIKNSFGDLDGALQTLMSLGEVEFLKGNIDKAISLYSKAYNQALSFGYLEDLELISRELSACYQELNNWDKAIYHLELSKSYRDSISDKLSDGLIYEINYEREKRNVLKLKERDARIEKQTYFFWILVILAVSFIVIFYILFKLNRQKRKAAELGIENLQKEKQITDLINEQEQAEMKAKFDGQESERNRISRELHDNLGGILSTVKLYFRAFDNQINDLKDENVRKYEKATALLDEACDETRKIAHQLSSKRLNDIGLFATIETLQNQVNDSGELKFNLHIHGNDDALKRKEQNSIYRIIQELVNNVTKHANAKEISIQLNVFDRVFNLIVEDDGVGFNVNNLLDNNGLGLREIEVRVKTMKGKFTIDSGQGVGTTITIDIPLTKEE